MLSSYGKILEDYRRSELEYLGCKSEYVGLERKRTDRRRSPEAIELKRRMLDISHKLGASKDELRGYGYNLGALLDGKTVSLRYESDRIRVSFGENGNAKLKLVEGEDGEVCMIIAPSSNKAPFMPMDLEGVSDLKLLPEQQKGKSRQSDGIGKAVDEVFKEIERKKELVVVS